MRIAVAGLTLSLGTLTLAGAVALEPSSGGGKDVHVKSGQEVEIGVFANINPACNGLPAPQIGVASAPAHGMLIVRFGLLRVPESTALCAGKQIPALAVVYRANVDEEGRDAARLQLIAGQATQSPAYTITITK